MEQFFSLALDDEARRKILWDNCARLYGIEAPPRP
jgi:predicted TIM-barrel fold metal-dependent hydrolase